MGYNTECLICNLHNCTHTWEEKDAERQDQTAKVSERKHEWDIFGIRSRGKATTWCQVYGCWENLSLRPTDKLINAIEWHSIFIGFKTNSFDGCSIHAECLWCGYKGMIDSQGNLF